MKKINFLYLKKQFKSDLLLSLSKTAISILLLTSCQFIYAQMNKWAMPDKEFDMTVSSPTNSSLISSSSPYSVSNGVFDENDNLLFYVQDYSIIDNGGNVFGELAISNQVSCEEGYYILNTEIVIVPIPTTCNKYYVIYALDNPIGASQLFYVIVDFSSGSPTTIYKSTIENPCYPNTPPFVNQAFKIPNHAGQDHLGIAASKYNSDSDFQSRFLYTVGFNGIDRSEITASGISTSTNVVSPSTLGLGAFLDFNTREIELSWDGNYLAWTSENDMVHVIGLFPDGTYNQYFESFQIEGPKGIEFDNKMNDPKLYVSSGLGLMEIDLSSNSVSQVSTPSFDLTNTYLEYGKSDKIYGISPVYQSGSLVSTTLVGIDPTNNSISSVSAANVDSRYTLSGSYTQGVFTLPDQIDGENYNGFTGYENLEVNEVSFNGEVVRSSCQGAANLFCAGDFIFMNIDHEGAIQTYSLSIHSVDANCQIDNDIVYNSGILMGDPSEAIIDINQLVNITSGVTLRVDLVLNHPCGQSYFHTGYLDVVAPVPAVTQLEIYDYDDPQIYLQPSTNINNPVGVGTATIGYRINNSTGDIKELRIEIDEVTNSGGSPQVVKNLYDETKTVPGVSAYTFEALNGYCIDISKWNTSPHQTQVCTDITKARGYFSAHGSALYNKIYRLRITLSNECSISTAYSYLQIDAIGLRIKSTKQIAEDEQILKLSLYPNPTDNKLNLEMNLEEDQNIEFVLTDAIGRDVKQLIPSTFTEKGNFRKSFDVSTMSPGVYLYQLKRNDNIKTGKIIIQ